MCELSDLHLHPLVWHGFSNFPNFIRGTTVKGSVVTRNGDIHLEDGTMVHGNLKVRRSKFNFGQEYDEPNVKVVIGRNSEVRGKLMFERKVELVVDETASIGPVEGVEPVQ